MQGWWIVPQIKALEWLFSKDSVRQCCSVGEITKCDDLLISMTVHIMIRYCVVVLLPPARESFELVEKEEA